MPLKSQEIMEVDCDFHASEKCHGVVKRKFGIIQANRRNNNGKFRCYPCARRIETYGSKSPMSKYKYNYTIFENIDTEQKAYFLGWIASDGTITERMIRFRIHVYDIECVKALRELVCPELKLNYSRNVVGFDITSHKIAQDACRALGISPGDKAYIIRLPKYADDKLTWAFLRGYFDGDGCACYKKGTLRNYPRATIASKSKMMLEDIKEFVKINCCISGHQVEYGGQYAMKFLSLIYANASIFLERKKHIYDLMLTW